MAIIPNNLPNLDRRTLMHFGLQKTGVFYSHKTRQVLDDLQYAVEDKKFILLNGMTGMGKTTLLRQLKDRLFRKVQFIHARTVADNKITMASLLEAIITDLGGTRRMSMEARTRQALRMLGNRVVNQKQPVCLVIDNTPERIHPRTFNSLKLLREEDYAGHAPLFSVLMLCWPDYLEKIKTRKDLDQRSYKIHLDEAHGWFTFDERMDYLEKVFQHALTPFARERVAQLFECPEDMNYYVSNLMYKGMKGGYKVIDEAIIQPRLMEIYQALKRRFPNEMSYQIIASKARVSKGTVASVLQDEPDTPSTPKVKEALDELLHQMNGGQLRKDAPSNQKQVA